MWAQQWIRASFQMSVSSGSLVGVFTIQGSNDQAVGLPPAQFSPTNWNNIGSGSNYSVVASISAGSSVLIPYFETCYQYHRVLFTAGNGGNTLGLYNIRAESRAL